MKNVLFAIFAIQVAFAQVPTTYPGPSTGSGYATSSKIVGSGGVAANNLVCYNTTATAVIICMANTNPVLGIATYTASAGSSVEVVLDAGQVVGCAFDGSTTAGNYAIPSSTANGACHDSGVSSASLISVTVGRVGRILDTISGTGTARVSFDGSGAVGNQVNSAAAPTIPTAKTSNYTVTTTDQIIPVNTSSSGILISLPSTDTFLSSLPAGHQVRIYDSFGSGYTNNVIIQAVGTGAKIKSGTSCLLNSNWSAVTLEFNPTTLVWSVAAGVCN